MCRRSQVLTAKLLVGNLKASACPSNPPRKCVKDALRDPGLVHLEGSETKQLLDPRVSHRTQVRAFWKLQRFVFEVLSFPNFPGCTAATCFFPTLKLQCEKALQSNHNAIEMQMMTLFGRIGPISGACPPFPHPARLACCLFICCGGTESMKTIGISRVPSAKFA